MKLRPLISVLILTLALSACNLPSNAPTATPTLSLITPSVTPIPSTSTPTLTPIPSNTPPPTATSTPTVPVAFPKEQNVNCRLGPGIGWLQLSALTVGTNAQIAGKSGDGGWWYVIDPLNTGRHCWVSASVTNTAGNLGGIPVVAAPTAAVTNVSVDIDPNTINLPGCMGPIQPSKITGTIETNGPGPVQWHFETQKDGVMPAQTTNFDAFGETEVPSAGYTPPLTAGTYWVRLIVTSPNAMQAETKYTVNCP